MTAPVIGPTPPPPHAEDAVERISRWLHAERFILRAIALAVVLVAVAFFLITSTDRGANLVVEQVLQRLPIKGEITAERARSDHLLQGVRLYGVAVRGEAE